MEENDFEAAIIDLQQAIYKLNADNFNEMARVVTSHETIRSVLNQNSVPHHLHKDGTLIFNTTADKNLFLVLVDPADQSTVSEIIVMEERV